MPSSNRKDAGRGTLFFGGRSDAALRGDVGIAPYVENTVVFSRIQCLHWTGMTLEGARSFFWAAQMPHPQGDMGIAYVRNTDCIL